MMKQRRRPCVARSTADRVAWLAGLALCVHTTTTEAQERPWRATARESYHDDQVHTTDTDARDPDLVRAGAYPTLDEALARGVTTERHGEADFDGDGRTDLVLLVTPSRDPYPFNQAPGLVVARHTAAGWSATVVARRWQSERTRDSMSDRYAWMPPVVGAREALLVVDAMNFVSHDPHDYYEHGVSFVRIDREGRLWEVGQTGWTGGAHSEPQCYARRYRFVGAGIVRGDGPGCGSIRLARRR